MTRLFALVPLVAVVIAMPGASSQDWDRGDSSTVRLKPAMFAQVPVAIRAELERRQCTIPQTGFDPKPANVVSGRFLSATSRDWAALCSRQRVSSILVFRGESAVVAAELASHPDKNFLQIVTNATPGFSRLIGSADPARIRRYSAFALQATLPVLDHDGIEDAFVGKGSVVWYWDSKRWLELQGMDLQTRNVGSILLRDPDEGSFACLGDRLVPGRVRRHVVCVAHDSLGAPASQGMDGDSGKRDKAQVTIET